MENKQKKDAQINIRVPGELKSQLVTEGKLLGKKLTRHCVDMIELGRKAMRDAAKKRSA